MRQKYAMRAMILAAGLGTRLRPLTFIRPKVLVPVMGISLLDFWIWQLHKAGFEAVIVNAFHLHAKLTSAIRGKNWPIPVDVRVESNLLGTAGGIRNVLDFFGGEPFVVVNGDIACQVDFERLMKRHVRSGCPVTLLLHDFPEFNNVLVNAERVLAFGHQARELQKEQAGSALVAFTGIHVLNPEVLTHIGQGVAAEIIPVYNDLIRSRKPPSAVLEPNLWWREIGSIEAYQALHAELTGLPKNAHHPLPSGEKLFIHLQAEVSPEAQLTEPVVIGKNSRIMPGASLTNSILWEGVKVGRNCRLLNCIVTDGVEVKGSHENEILYEKR
jgi:mannose-1-phosphate guanylyltransferase